MIRSAVTAHHRRNDDAAGQCQRWRKPAVHDGYGYVQMLYAPRQGHHRKCHSTSAYVIGGLGRWGLAVAYEPSSNAQLTAESCGCRFRLKTDPLVPGECCRTP